MYTVQSLLQDLRGMGIQSGDTLLVHSSIKSVGPVENGGDGILDALMAAVAPSGLLVLPTLTYDRCAKGDPVFDARKTPAIIGVLPNLFLKRAGVVRSLHPTHSVAAYGPDAAAFTAGHETWNTPAARQSPWGRLVDRHAKILFVGCGIGCNTFFHAVEEWHHGGGLSDWEETLYTILPDGSRLAVPSRRHQGDHSQFYAKMRPLLNRHGVLRQGRMGDAACDLLDAAGAAAYVDGLLERYPGLFTDNRIPEES